MCDTCGCADPTEVPRLTAFRIDPAHHHDGHGHNPPAHENRVVDRMGGDQADGARPDGDDRRTVLLEQQVLARNDELAAASRARLAARGVLAVNLMSSPGAGKTTLLERTVRDLAQRHPVAVVEGDQESVRDAERIRSAGVPVVQVNTGRGCHLDAAMVDRALHALDPPARAVVFVENVGNLVCPALFDLGEGARVVLLSVTEGEDKPVKYPHMFARADLVLLTKCDLLPYLGLDRDRLVAQVHRANPGAAVMALSGLHHAADTPPDILASDARPPGALPVDGTGLSDWYAWLRSRRDGLVGGEARDMGGV
ncbi:Hydrogenase nickel incorporation protein HypB [Frankia canadensis]|uniref:Hydrogenase nickel incorporation protein HypB n=1 Tax=Frankia canadensis TaxID=1836972 RepID=A0A2I2L2M8_9ACTN|nr:hydrogenase nickel incorporation protein HypB [Frankia canadensis]SNQ52155.1 Hydrogenase nickel incorporation protein HypB [Frankia canadensis]SOU59445.1 Hydrogenase nickel incorporation protein HypB [Frankia canadensis]